MQHHKIAFDQLPGGAALYVLLAIFALISLAKHWRRDAALYAYCLLTVALFIIWPERQGLRFIYPVLPVLLIAGFDGLRLVIARLKISWQARALGLMRVFWGAVMLVCLGISAHSAYQITAGGREINGPFDTYSKQMYAFIREKTPTQSVIIFMKPRALRLFTDRESFMTQRCEDLVKGDFVVLHLKMDGNGQIPPEQIGSCDLSLSMELVYQNKRFVVYQIQR